MAKSKAPKPPKSRPVSTADLNQPLLPSTGATAASTSSCSFSPAPDHGLLAHISNQVHQQRLKVYNASASAAEQHQIVTDYLLQQGASCLSSQWVRLAGSTASPKKSSSKRRKHSQAGSSQSAQEEDQTSGYQLLLALGLASGQVHLFSPSLAKAVAIFDASSAAGSGSAAAANSGVVSLSQSISDEMLFACSKNGWVSAFALAGLQTGADATPIKPLSSFRPDQKSAVQAVSVLGSHLLAAHHSITLVDTANSSHKTKATFTGHASPITHLEWLTTETFVSAAEGDRVIYVWAFEDAATGKAAQGKPVATVALDAPVRCIAVSRSPAASPKAKDTEERLHLLIITQTGSVRVYALPDASSANATPGKKAKGSILPTLELVSQVEAATTAEADWLDGKFVPTQGSPIERLRLARLIRGAKVVIEDVLLLDPKTGNLRKNVELAKHSSTKSLSSNGRLLAADDEDEQMTGGSSKTQRYVEPPSRSTDAADSEMASLREAGLADGATASFNGDEPTLAQRLNGLGFADEEEDDDEQVGSRKLGLLSEASLSSSLSQALHSGDSSLLSSCLNHNDAGLIRATVRGITGPLAVKLLEECVARLNGVSGSYSSKGTIGSQRARALIEWTRATLLNHMGYLMSLPHLVSRMSSLHATLTSRIATHERLLALNGRLELVLSQIEARAAYVEQAAARSGRRVQVQGVKFDQARHKVAGKALQDERARREGKKWVEESDDEDVDAMDVDENGAIVRGEEDEDEDAEIQDIALGAEEDDDDSEEDEDEEDSDEEQIVTRRKPKAEKNGMAVDGSTSAESDEEEEEEESDEGSDEDEEDESDLEEEGASDLEEDEEKEEDDEEDAHGPNGMFDLQAEEGSDESE